MFSFANFHFSNLRKFLVQHYCYRLVLIHLFQSFFVQFATHYLSARGLGQAYLLTSFGLCGWYFARLGNVYDCEALAIIISLFCIPFLVLLPFQIPVPSLLFPHPKL